jgi:hypothetical protein
MPQRESREPSEQLRGVRVAHENVGGAPNLEHLAREIGRRWGLRMRSEHVAPGDSVGNWPGTLDDARRLVDSAVKEMLPHEERELLAMLIERGARRAWHAQTEAP